MLQAEENEEAEVAFFDVEKADNYDNNYQYCLLYTSDLAFDYELEYGVVISPLVKNEEHFKKWSETLPFYRNVKQEGVTVDAI